MRTKDGVVHIKRRKVNAEIPNLPSTTKDSDAVSNLLSIPIMQLILYFIPAPIRFLAKLTCNSWYRTIRDAKDYTHLNVSKQGAVAAENGYLDYLKFLTKKGYKWSSITCENAASGGQIELLKFLSSNGIKWHERAYLNAAREGQLQCLIYMHEHGPKLEEIKLKKVDWQDLGVQMCYVAACGGHLEVLRFLHKFEFKSDFSAPAGAAKFGHLECLQFFNENGVLWDEGTTAAAAKHGHLDCLMFARENGCEWDFQTPDQAAKGGHLECLRYALENGCSFLSTANYAMEGGYLDCLKCAINYRAGWGKQTCTILANKGYLNLLQLARENGFPWDEQTCQAAAANKHYDCLKYAQDNGCPCPPHLKIMSSLKQSLKH